MSLLHHYLDIQRVRFGDKLKVNFNIQDSATRALVPSLILQPLVENAIRHGIGPRISGGVIDVTVANDDRTLSIDIVDDGLGVAARRSRERSRGTGLGLANTATRLNHLYGSRHVFETGPALEGGFAVHLTIPLRYARLTPTAAELDQIEVAI